MRIAVVASSIVPGNSLGIEHFTYRLLNALVKSYPRDEFVILIPAGTQDAWRLRVPQRTNLTFVPIRFSPTIRGGSGSGRIHLSDSAYSVLKNQHFIRVIYRKLRQFELRRVLNDQKADIVYSPFHIEVLSFSNWGTVLSVHDLREIMPEFFDEEKAHILKVNIDNSEAIIVAWKHPFDQLKEVFPESRKKSHIIPFPIPISPNGLQPKMLPGIELLLFASALRPQKNHVNLIRALRPVVDQRKKDGRTVRLICAGTIHSPIYEELLQEILNLDLEEYVEFTGFISDDALRQLYAQANMVVTPTLWEAASGAVFEAFSFEKPVACSRIPPIISQVEQSHGLVNYFDPYSPHDIARAILEVLENPASYIEGARRGAQFLRALNWEKTAQDYMQVFRQVALSKFKRSI